MSRILVIRFGALGDLCLLAWSLAKLGAGERHDTTHHVTLVTKAGFADLAARIPGVSEVAPLPGPRFLDLVSLANRLRAERYDAVIDAHNNLRSHLLLALLTRRPQRRLGKDTAARLGLLFFRRRRAKLTRTMRDRFDELSAPLALADAPAAGSADHQTGTSPPLSHLKSAAPPTGPALGIAPGARWDAKRWPASHYAVFLQTFRQLSSAPVHLFLGPQEETWFADSLLARVADRTSDVTVWRQPDLVALATGLSGCSTLLTNDSGLMHLAEAVGTPVLALFGPTVEEFGYFPNLPSSRVVQKDMDCRPCSRNGKRPCWRQDQACLAEISPARVQECLASMPPWSELIWPEG